MPATMQELFEELIFSPEEEVGRLIQLIRLRQRKSAEIVAATKTGGLNLSIYDLTTIYLSLHTHIRREAYRKRHDHPKAGSRVDADKISDYIYNSLIDYPATTPAAMPFYFRCNRNDAAFILTILRNKKRDNWRADRLSRKYFVSLDTLRDNGDETNGDEFSPSFDPPSQDDPERALLQTEVRKALAELPPELADLAKHLPLVDGNVSELARRFGRPQRRTARQIERIKKHFLKFDLQP